MYSHCYSMQYEKGEVNQLSYLVGAEICEMLTVVVIAVCFGRGVHLKCS